jgi:hypothetical protein
MQLARLPLVFGEEPQHHGPVAFSVLAPTYWRAFAAYHYPGGAMSKDAQYLADLEREKWELWAPTEEASLSAGDLAVRTVLFSVPKPTDDVIVAEGDSWFDYALGRDVLHQLKREHGWKIVRVSDGGDTLENMVYGTDIDRKSFRRKAPSWWETREQLQRHRPKVFLFSGGGNDFAGPELESLLNHANARGLSELRTDVVDYLFNTVSRQAFLDLFDSVWAASPSTTVVIHGYGYPIPDGRAARVLGFGAGPWLRPALAKKGHTDPTRTSELMREIVDRFNDMLEALANGRERVRYIDLRDMIKPSDWENELHLSDAGFAKVAARFHSEIGDIGNS